MPFSFLILLILFLHKSKVGLYFCTIAKKSCILLFHRILVICKINQKNLAKLSAFSPSSAKEIRFIGLNNHTEADFLVVLTKVVISILKPAHLTTLTTHNRETPRFSNPITVILFLVAHL